MSDTGMMVEYCMMSILDPVVLLLEGSNNILVLVGCNMYSPVDTLEKNNMSVL
jgi:hypothetical protein